MNESFKFCIIGHGFVGKAVDFGFESPAIKKLIIDPIYGTSLDDMIRWQPDFVFVCAPTPMGKDGVADDSIVREAVKTAYFRTEAIIVVKSTVPPSFFSDLRREEFGQSGFSRVVYNPEFLTESNPMQQFVNPDFIIVGGDSDMCNELMRFYECYSRVVVPERVVFCTQEEASYIKYGINSFLATKVTFFNQLFDEVKGNSYAHFNIISKGIAADSRIGSSHINVPGFDGKRGFGGACFPKDVMAFIKDSKGLTLLETAVDINNSYRLEYELDEREKVNSISYEESTTSNHPPINGRVLNNAD